ncbi:MAG: acetyl-CoA acetyltransferase [Pseudomonadales bacterium]|nr:acetyl-CoA acetyltransferase [Pseudomonadales bacterium]
MVYILGGYQTDFSRNWAREGLSLFDMFAQAIHHGLEATQLDASEIETGHVGNFVSDLFTGQAHLGGFFGHVDAAMATLPASRHEAACASGSMAILAAMAEIEAGRYDLACVTGIEMMRNVPGEQAAHNLRAAAWSDKEWCDTAFVWPCAFDQLISVYEARYGISKEYLAAISKKNFSNGKQNPNAQTRNWQFADDSFTESEQANPTVIGQIRKQDCGQITDGAAVVFLASEQKAADYAKKRGLKLSDIPRIKGWGHINAPMLFEEKVKLGNQQPWIFPHICKLFQQTLRRAGFSSINSMDGMEVHDCFNITEYMVTDHCGLYKPGEAWKAIEEGITAPGGKLPINMSGGLIGLGHPVGATGVRMLLDCFKQVSGQAGNYQIANAANMMTFNLGGSATTCASFIVGN